MNIELKNKLVDAVRKGSVHRFNKLSQDVDIMYNNYQQHSAEVTYYSAIAEVLNSQDKTIQDNAIKIGLTVDRLDLKSDLSIRYLNSLGVKINGVNQ